MSEVLTGMFNRSADEGGPIIPVMYEEDRPGIVSGISDASPTGVGGNSGLVKAFLHQIFIASARAAAVMVKMSTLL